MQDFLQISLFDPQLAEQKLPKKRKNICEKDIGELSMEDDRLGRERDWLEGAIYTLHRELKDLAERFEDLEQAIETQTDEFVFDRLLYRSASFYKAELSEIKRKEKELVKKDMAVISRYPFELRGLEDYCAELLKNAKQQAVKLFDLRCNSIISSVKTRTVDQSAKEIDEAAQKVLKLNALLFLKISRPYIRCKHKELSVSYQYQLKIEEEKEAARADREAEREARRVARELAEERRRIEKEQYHYENAKQLLDGQRALKKDANHRKILLKKREGF